MTYNLLEKFRPDDIASKLELSRASSGLSFCIECNDKFVEVPCPGFGSSDGVSFKFKKHGFSRLECSACNTIFVNPRPTEEMPSQFYRESHSPQNGQLSLMIPTKYAKSGSMPQE